MVENSNIGNKFDAAWKAAQQQLIKDGNQKPTTQDILHYLIEKWRPQNNQAEQIVVQGFHLEHDSTPSLKYGVNIGCKPQLIQHDSVPKYGANAGCQPEVDTQEVMMKYGANAGCKPQIDIQESVPKYGANAGCQPEVDTQETMMKYGANIGCGDKTLKINSDSLKIILEQISANDTLTKKTPVYYNRTTGTLYINRDKED